jgi:hypothetical protein
MAFSQADVDALNKAIASGELTVRFGDTSVTYRSLDELLRARDVVSREVSGATRTHTLAAFSKG